VTAAAASGAAAAVTAASVTAAKESLTPRLTSMLDATTSAGGPVAAEARHRGVGALAALRGDVPELEQQPRWRVALTFLGIGVAAGTAAGILARRFSSPAPPVPASSPWQATTATSPSTATSPTTAGGAATGTGTQAADSTMPPVPAAPPVPPASSAEATVFDNPVPSMPTAISDEDASGLEPA